MSAAGALMSELSSDHAQVLYTTSARFEFESVNALLKHLHYQCEQFAAGPGAGALETTIELSVEARYPHQIWEIEIPIERGSVSDQADLNALKIAFHAAHKTLFEINDLTSEVEFVTWRAHVKCRLRPGGTGRLAAPDSTEAALSRRPVFFSSTGWVNAPVARFEAMKSGESLAGPAIVELSFTTVVIDPGATAERSEGGGLRVTF